MQWFPRARKSGEVMNAGSDLTKAGSFVGRLGPLAAALGIGLAVMAGGTGVAAADSVARDASSVSKRPTQPADAGRVRGNRDPVARGASARPDDAPTARVTSRPVRPSRSELAPVAALVPQIGTPTAPPVDAVPPGPARRENSAAVVAAESTAPQPLSAHAVATDPISSLVRGVAAFFNNQTPQLRPTQTAQDPAGVVTGLLNANDPDSPRLSYTITEGPTHGVATVSPEGTWAYTPDAAVAAGVTDSFRVTVSDAPSGFAIHGLAGLLNLLSFGLIGSRGDSSTSPVAVIVAPFTPANRAPVLSAPVVGTPNAVTGVVTGSVSATDADGDVLTYSAPTSTAKGAININASTGAFTYTPTVAARNTAAAPGATPTDRADSFTVTVIDGRSGTAGTLVTVAVSPTPDPANRAPVLSAPVVGTPNAVTGVVTGSVSATDADGDVLTYSAPTSTAKGAININATTGAFTYTPTVAARNTAAAPGATPTDRADSFTVTVIDGRSGTAGTLVTVAVSPTPDASVALAAFPGAEGFGAAATGGRDGSVIYVTNLNAAGPGSLQWAIDQPGARYILFKVSGLIDTQIHLTNGDVTIAGQTSPGGITIRGFVTDETPYQDQTVRAPEDFAENWILQHLRIRPGATGPADDGLRLRYTRNAIVDHVSIGNAVDEAIEISYSNNITVQNTLLAETVGSHSFYGGILMNYSNPAHGFGLDNVSLHHNVFNRIEGRLPEGSRESAAAANSFMNLELSNNLYWDPRFFVALGVDTAVAGGQPIYWKLNAVNNLFHTANSFQYGMFDDQILNVARNELFVSGNKMNLYPSRSDYQLFYCCNDYPAETSPDATSRRAQARITRHPFPTITYTPTDQLRTVLLNTAGAWPRDPMDTRLMSFVASNTISGAAPSTNPAGDALRPAFTGPAPAAPTDTDSDGMPDAWEITKGTNPSVANTNARTLSAVGYTDLEVYLNELSTSRIIGTV
ncbi:VCBS repeat [Mycobacteriaceae bacterium]